MSPLHGAETGADYDAPRSRIEALRNRTDGRRGAADVGDDDRGGAATPAGPMDRGGGGEATGAERAIAAAAPGFADRPEMGRKSSLGFSAHGSP